MASRRCHGDILYIAKASIRCHKVVFELTQYIAVASFSRLLPFLEYSGSNHCPQRDSSTSKVMREVENRRGTMVGVEQSVKFIRHSRNCHGFQLSLADILGYHHSVVYTNCSLSPEAPFDTRSHTTHTPSERWKWLSQSSIVRSFVSSFVHLSCLIQFFS